MSSGLAFYLTVWIPVEAMSLLFLWIGSRISGHPLLLRVGAMAHERKMNAIDRIWPLTRLPDAIERNRLGVSTLILSTLIVIKSAGALAIGIIMVFWLPFAALVVPSIVRAHDPDDDALRSRIKVIAAMQVTSHTLAAALGFIWTTAVWFDDRAWTEALASAPSVALAAGTLSIVFAVAAGRLEARTVHEIGL